jgi:hypothetical protein
MVFIMNVETETYKGYPIHFVEKILGKQKVVVAEFPSKVTDKVLSTTNGSHDLVLEKCKKMIDDELSYQGFKKV